MSDRNTGSLNTGDFNTGDFNMGNRNTGSLNTGSRNTGNRNTGNWNTGSFNTGDFNTGSFNTGSRNTGNWNTGSFNTGEFNTGSFNTGHCNTSNGPVRMFNKYTDVSLDVLTTMLPQFFFFDAPCLWVPSRSMQADEKANHPEHEIVGGYIKTIDMKAGWRESWDKATDKDRRKCLALPNWDNEVFKEISGIDVEAELTQDVQEMTVADVEKLVGKKVKIIK